MFDFQETMVRILFQCHRVIVVNATKQSKGDSSKGRIGELCSLREAAHRLSHRVLTS